MSKHLTSIIKAITQRDYVVATESIAQVLQSKIASALANEKQRIAGPLVAEATSDPFKYECGNCDKKFSSQSMDPKCPECGKKDYVAPREGVGSYRKEDVDKAATPGKCVKCGKPAQWYHSLKNQKFCNDCAPNATMTRITPVKKEDCGLPHLKEAAGSIVDHNPYDPMPKNIPAGYKLKYQRDGGRDTDIYKDQNGGLWSYHPSKGTWEQQKSRRAPAKPVRREPLPLRPWD